MSLDNARALLHLLLIPIDARNASCIQVLECDAGWGGRSYRTQESEKDQGMRIRALR